MQRRATRLVPGLTELPPEEDYNISIYTLCTVESRQRANPMIYNLLFLHIKSFLGVTMLFLMEQVTFKQNLYIF